MQRGQYARKVKTTKTTKEYCRGKNKFTLLSRVIIARIIYLCLKKGFSGKRIKNFFDQHVSCRPNWVTTKPTYFKVWKRKKRPNEISKLKSYCWQGIFFMIRVKKSQRCKVSKVCLKKSESWAMKLNNFLSTKAMNFIFF